MNSKRAWGVLAVSAALGGCGGDLDDFLGTWSTNETQATTCNGATVNSTSTGSVAVNEGVSSDLAFVLSNGCATNWTVNGDTATVDSGQSCTVKQAGVTAVVTINTGTATTPDGKTMTYSMTASGSVNGATCTIDLNGTATKVSK